MSCVAGGDGCVCRNSAGVPEFLRKSRRSKLSTKSLGAISLTRLVPTAGRCLSVYSPQTPMNGTNLLNSVIITSKGKTLDGQHITMDHVSSEKRSEIMRAVRSKNSIPEMAVRHLIHRLGYRYRLHSRELPGTPDIVFPSRRKVIFIHGCFWHGHRRCSKARSPKSRTHYWKEKVETNRERDSRNLNELTDLGWETQIVWQCELRHLEQLKSTIVGFLEHERKVQTNRN